MERKQHFFAMDIKKKIIIIMCVQLPTQVLNTRSWLISYCAARTMGNKHIPLRKGKVAIFFIVKNLLMSL